MKQGSHVKLTKVFTSNPNPHGIEDGYWLKGYLLRDVEKGERMEVRRYARAPKPDEPAVEEVKLDGLFHSSPVINIVGDVVVTQNSSYKLEILP